MRGSNLKGSFGVVMVYEALSGRGLGFRGLGEIERLSSPTLCPPKQPIVIVDACTPSKCYCLGPLLEIMERCTPNPILFIQAHSFKPSIPMPGNSQTPVAVRNSDKCMSRPVPIANLESSSYNHIRSLSFDISLSTVRLLRLL